MKTKRILALTLSMAMILGVTACADTAQETIIETSVETTEQIETTVEETEETVVETEETEETVVETEAVVERELAPYFVDDLSAEEVYNLILSFADVSDDATYSTFADRFAVIPLELPEDYPDSVENGFRTWQFDYTPFDEGVECTKIIDNVTILDVEAVDEDADTIVGGRLGAMIVIDDEAYADELFNLFNDYLEGLYGEGFQYGSDEGQSVDYEESGCYISNYFNSNINAYAITVAVEINT